MTRKLRRFIICCGACIAIALLLVSTPSLYAQVSGGTIEGLVTDPTGAVIPGATVIIRNQATNVSHTITTNSVGRYSVPSLLPGMYTVTVSAAGFRTQAHTNMQLTVGAVRAMDFKLTIGTATEKVQVSTTASRVQTTSNVISGVVGKTRITQLPLNGRDWTQLATLQPGVFALNAGEKNVGGRVQTGSGQQMTINGGRPWENDYRLDGISINDYANGAPGSALGVNLGVDAIQEFSVVTSNYPAQYGRSSGGIINAVTKSGTNQLHGDVYEFIRNSAVDARNYFNPGAIPPFKRNQYGESLGGPIRKNKDFFFEDIEGVRQNEGLSVISEVPTAATRAGHLPGGVNVTVDPTVLKFINAFYPLPNGLISSNGETGEFVFNGPFIESESFETGKFNQQLSNRDSLDETFLNDTSQGSQPDEMNNKNKLFSLDRQIATIEEDHTFSSNFVNTAHAGYVRVYAQSGNANPINPLAASPAFGSIPGGDAPSVGVPGLVKFSGGITAVILHEYWWDDLQFNDDAFYNIGNHSLHFGMYYEHINDNEFSVATRAGTWQFGSISNFLTNQPLSFESVLPGNLSVRGIRQNIFASYFEDDWHARRNLVLNLGVRYEMSSVPTEEHNHLANLPTMSSAVETLGSPLFRNPTKMNFDPRVGFAWDPRNNGRTAVRGGFGIFDVLPLPYEMELENEFSYPYFIQGTDTNMPAGSFGGETGYNLILHSAVSKRGGFIQHHPKLNYVEHWNLNIQQQLTNNLSLMVAYVGSHSLHIVTPSDDGNMTVPTLTSTGLYWPQVFGSPRINPNYGRISAVHWTGTAYYDALETRLTENMTHGVQLQASYTWGKSMDTTSTSVGTDAFRNSLKNPQWFYPRLNYGPSDFDIRQNLMINSVWAIGGPFESGMNGGIKGFFKKGWQVGNIMQIASGNPFNVILGGDPNGQLSSVNQELPNRNFNVPGCQGSLINPRNPVHFVKTQCFSFPNPVNKMGDIGRNAVQGPGQFFWSASVDKMTALTERLRMQVRVEAFNLPNHTNFTWPIPNNIAFSQTGQQVGALGRVVKTATSNRELQGAVKLFF